MSNGSYENVIDGSYDVPITGSHLHRCDAQLLLLFLVDMRSLSVPLVALWELLHIPVRPAADCS